MRRTVTSKEILGLSIWSTEGLHTEVLGHFTYRFENEFQPSHMLNFALFTVNLPCGQCKKIFHKACFLQMHKKFVHSGERRMFKCTREGCQKSYTTKFNLENHILVFHEGKCDFTCHFAGCGKAFAMEVRISLFFF